MKLDALNRKEIGMRLLEIRSKAGLSQREIGPKLNVSWRTYQNYEIGEREVSSSVVSAIYQVFNVDPVWLLLGEEQKYRQDNDKILIDVVHRIEKNEVQLNLEIEPEKKAQLLLMIYEREKAGEIVTDSELITLLNLAG